MDSVEDGVELVYNVSGNYLVTLTFLKVVHDLGEAEEVALHGVHLPNQGIQGIPQFVRDGGVDQGEEGLLCLGLVVEDLVGHIDYL